MWIDGGAHVVISSTTIALCTARRHGGGIGITGGAQVRITEDTTIESNEVEWECDEGSLMDGGGCAMGEEVLFPESQGGGVWINDAQVDILSSTVSRNKCLPVHYPYVSNGGGVFVGGSDADVTISNSYIIYNEASAGGGLFIDGASDGDGASTSVHINAVNIDNNRAYDGDPGWGGGVYITCTACAVHTVAHATAAIVTFSESHIGLNARSHMVHSHTVHLL